NESEKLLRAEVEQLRQRIADDENQKPAIYVKQNAREWLDEISLMSARFSMQFRTDDAVDDYCVPMYFSPIPQSRITEQDAREIATQFFYWWHNQPGKNTEQGFGEWMTGEGRTLLDKL